MSDLFTHREHNCPTAWCREGGKCPPKPEHNPAPEFFGYDVSKVPTVKCMSCKEPIGGKEYREDRGFARFGSMLFWCLPCVLESDVRTRRSFGIGP